MILQKEKVSLLNIILELFCQVTLNLNDSNGKKLGFN